MEPITRNVFISHYHGDDAHVDTLAGKLAGRNYNIRNSSIRKWRRENQERWKGRQVKDETIKRLLRRKVTWAGTVIVLIGKETASRPWVDWEIGEASRQGKNIVGVFIEGASVENKPKGLKDYGCTCVRIADVDKIISAIEGEEQFFEGPDGAPDPIKTGTTETC